MYLRITFLTIFLLSLMFYAFRAPWIKASCPVGPGSSAGGYIQLDNGGGQSGFLSTSQDLIQATNKFSTSGLCINEQRASIPQFSIPTYDEMKSLYFAQYRSTNKATINIVGNKNQGDILLSGSGDQLYNIVKSSPAATDANLEIVSNIPGNNTGVIFVDGNLHIKTSNNKLDYGSQTTGLVFVVKGNTYIDHDMGGTGKEIDAVFISYGQFCSSSTGDFTAGAGTGVSCEAAGTSAPLLTIKGAVVYLDSSSRPSFVRSNGDNSDPGEQLIYDPKYLIILKDIFSKDLTIWKEVQ